MKVTLTDNTHHLPAGKVHCIGCRQIISIAFAVYGKLWGKTSFKTIVTEECIWSPILQRLENVVTEKSVPIESYSTGYICDGCLTSRCIERTRRDGTVYKIPRCIIAARPSSVTTVNPGYNRHVDASSRVEPESRPLNVARSVRDGTIGSGALLWDPLTDKVRQEVVPTVDAACYRKFGGR
jgi:hypothetical protein